MPLTSSKRRLIVESMFHTTGGVRLRATFFGVTLEGYLIKAENIALASEESLGGRYGAKIRFRVIVTQSTLAFLTQLHTIANSSRQSGSVLPSTALARAFDITE